MLVEVHPVDDMRLLEHFYEAMALDGDKHIAVCIADGLAAAILPV